jgi:uncharacterized membrane protein YedE/YeeE
MSILVSAVAGLLFGLGLIVSGMADPAKVQNFLDVFGTWDPSLAFVMGGALLVAFIGYRSILLRDAPLLEPVFHVPKTNAIDRRLVAGAAVFGIGWGLGGFCPGPAIVSLPLFAKGTVVFVAAMIAGIAIVRLGLTAAVSQAAKPGAASKEAAKSRAVKSSGALKAAKG